jgi:hypothetical protein
MVGGRQIIDHDPGAYRVECDSHFEATTVTSATAGPSASLDAADVAWLGLDLVAALRRQASFMRRALDRKAELTAGMMAASGAYSGVLTAASQAAPGTLEPTLAVDLLRVWHTHMGFPRKYAQDCVRLTGMLLHHDDEPRHVQAP